jgi:HAD superfamily hydrolase (TIGR01509 family)
VNDLLTRALACKAVLLDLDNTLYAFKPCHEEGLKVSHARYASKVRRLSFRSFCYLYAKSRAEVKKTTAGQAASHSRLLYFQRMIELTQKHTDPAKALDLEKAYWTAYMKAMQLREWVRPLLRLLRRKGIKTVIVTDMTAEWQMKKIRKLKLAGLIDFLVTSEEAGVEKPDPAIFKFALKKARCRPEQAILIGDDPRKDCCRFMDCYLV